MIGCEKRHKVYIFFGNEQCFLNKTCKVQQVNVDDICLTIVPPVF
jgi:hypothetical protein